MKAESIVTRAGIILHDTTQVRWLESELLGWLNDAQREIVLIRPDASVKNEELQLQAGTKQSLPDGGIRVMDVVRNTDGDAIRVIDRNVLDAQQPNWHTVGAKSSVEHFMFDLRDPKHFYVYPPQSADTTTTVVNAETGLDEDVTTVNAGRIELIYSSAPDDVVYKTDATALTSETITLDDIYGNGILDYILYRAYSKDADFAGNAERALKHYETFVTTLGLKFQADKMIDPNAAIQSV